ncbi:hypothetical protein BSK48_17085 [Paenibacillus odorifer]|uniref:hypothetical protein n=1 Tax=Paenibacillus odorifer TaxID=189426 RepID=UPI00096C862D|nr:hypothetical protein [Paenibacillus odorifer]OMD69190.1 hypothetical protein BSK48_17085 [Paenibacillus odorifer]
MLTAGDLVPTIKKLAESFLEEIGDEDNVQNSFIFQYLNQGLRRLVHLAYQQKDSDALYISSDGLQIFTVGGAPITNMYSPLRILDPQGRDMQKRVSYADTRGWWREATNTNITIKGYALATNPLPQGEHILQYLAYPSTVSSLQSRVEFPDAGSMGLCYYVAGLILESRPTAKDLVNHYYGLADGYWDIVLLANTAGRGVSSGGMVPSQADAKYFYSRKV